MIIASCAALCLLAVPEVSNLRINRSQRPLTYIMSVGKFAGSVCCCSVSMTLARISVRSAQQTAPPRYRDFP